MSQPQPGAADDGPFSIEITDAQSRITVDLDQLQRIAIDLLRHEDVASASISIALIDGATMQELNRQHLGHDYDTDVLSFLLDEFQLDESEPEATTSDRPRGTGKTLDGEILISGDVTAKSAADVGWSDQDEATLYLVHGLLHLVGYDDLTENERQIMRERERSHLGRWHLTPTYADDEAADDPSRPALPEAEGFVSPDLPTPDS